VGGAILELVVQNFAFTAVVAQLIGRCPPLPAGLSGFLVQHKFMKISASYFESWWTMLSLKTVSAAMVV
jgi:hypothetical protein